MKNTFSSERHTMGLHLFRKQTFEMNIQSNYSKIPDFRFSKM